MEDLPSLAEFELLLQGQDVLRDYFNAFLNLPVFAKRLTYCAESCKFVIEPRVKSNSRSLHERGVWSWLVGSRLPLFWTSELHLEYRLLQQLIEANPAVAMDVCSVAMMDDFRRFLYQTEGVCLWLFWKEVERLKLTKSKKLSAKIFHHIQTTFLQDGALLTLPKCVKERTVFVCGAKQKSLRALSDRLELLNTAQELSLRELVHYWSLRYIIHSLTTETSHNIFQTFSREIGCENVHSDHQTLLPSVIFDRGGIKDDRRPKKVSHINLSALSLPSLVTKEEKEVAKSDKNTPEPLISPSTHSLFPSRSDYSRHRSSILQDIPLLPYLYAFLRADALAGRPFLLYLTKHAPNACGYLLFWQSVEILVAQDEMKRLCSCNDGQLWDQLVFFEEYPVARDLHSLVGLFLSGRAPHRVDLPHRVKRKELCALVSMGLGHSTLLTVQEHSATMLFSHWQNYLVQDYQLFMDACLAKKHRKHNVLDSLCVEHPPLPGQLLETVFHPPSLQAAWRALSYAEAAKYSGIHVLPSRCHLPAHREATPTDPEEYLMELVDAESLRSLAGVELSPMVTIIRDRLMYDWEDSKIKRTLHYTTTTLLNQSADRQKIPRTISEVLRNKEQLNVFRNFVFKRDMTSDMPLQFLKAVEDVKSSLDKQNDVTSKVQLIQDKFLTDNEDCELGGNHPILQELAQIDAPSLSQLEEAQKQLMKSMEICFFGDYISHLKSKDKNKRKKDRKSDKTDEKTKDNEATSTPQNTTKVLWKIFTDSIIGFRRGLMNTETAQLFRNFLKNEVKKGHTKTTIGSKLVNFSKLLNDLSFWTEVERYKELVDSLRGGERTTTPEDDIMINKKALAIINCFLDSNVTPRVQVNIPIEVATEVLNRFSNGRVTRGLFHKASLSLFPGLIIMWKRFCAHRFGPPSDTPTVSERRAPAVSLLAQLDQQRLFWDGPILSFSLALGIKWHYPHNYHMMLEEFRAQLAATAATAPQTVATAILES